VVSLIGADRSGACDNSNQGTYDRCVEIMGGDFESVQDLMDYCRKRAGCRSLNCSSSSASDCACVVEVTSNGQLEQFEPEPETNTILTNGTGVELQQITPRQPAPVIRSTFSRVLFR
jgi:hypothetical protein